MSCVANSGVAGILIEILISHHVTPGFRFVGSMLDCSWLQRARMWGSMRSKLIWQTLRQADVCE